MKLSLPPSHPTDEPILGIRTRRNAIRLLNVAGLAFAIAVFGVINFASIADSVGLLLSGTSVYDWTIYQESVDRIGTARMYEWGDGYRHRYPPLFAYAIAPFTWMGLDAWRVLHVAVLALLPWRLAAITLASFPFWFDLAHAGPMTFVFVAGYLALRGSSAGFFTFLLMGLLMPRPLMLPVLAWVLWKRPQLRLPAAGVTVVYLLLTIPSGELTAFLVALPGSSDAFAYPSNWGPTRFIGWLGVPVSLALGLWLTRLGRIGLASVAISPYIVPYYWIMLLLEIPPRWVTRDRREESRAPGRSRTADGKAAYGASKSSKPGGLTSMRGPIGPPSAPIGPIG